MGQMQNQSTEYQNGTQIGTARHAGGQHGRHGHAYEFATIFIDQAPYKAINPTITGGELRMLATPPIGDEKDLFHVIPGNVDNIKLGDLDVVDVSIRESKRDRHFYSAPKVTKPSHDEISKKAYEIYVSEGCKHGNDVKHWVAAEVSLIVR